MAKVVSVNKSAFVRSLPETMRADDVVERAKLAGFEITRNQVHTIRRRARRPRRKGAQKSTRRRPSTTGSAPFRIGSGEFFAEVEHALIRIIDQRIAQVVDARLAVLLAGRAEADGKKAARTESKKPAKREK